MTREETIKILKALETNYQTWKIEESHAKDLLDLWEECFSDYSYSQVRSAVIKIITTESTPFAPSIGKIISIIKGDNPIKEKPKKYF